MEDIRFLRSKLLSDDNSTSSSSLSPSSHYHLYYNYSDLSYYYPHEGNSSITTSVTIHVTPEHYHLISWSCLWAGFILSIAFASYQVYLEQKQFLASSSTSSSSSMQHNPQHHHNHHPHNHHHHHHHHHSSSHHNSSNISGNINNSNATSNSNTVGDLAERASNDGDQIAVSSSDITRSRFRRLLLLAMSTRAIMIPVQMWSDPLWAQFVADTLPEMAFASAWTLLVSFFVQLVGIASGTGNTTSTGMVIQMTAYVVYIMLVATYFWNPLASVLLYALLCCIYAALLGTTLFFYPRLLTLLQPSLRLRSGLGIRLILCTVICIVVFGGRTIGFARKVVAPPRHVSWWGQYGAMELIPSILFLVMMHPSNNVPSSSRSNNNGGGGGSSSSGTITPPNGKDTSYQLQSGHQHRRQGSFGSGKRSGETAPLIKPQLSAYGTSGGGGGGSSSGGGGSGV